MHKVNAQDALAGLLSAVDAHSKSMALRVYCVRTLEDVTKLAELLYKDVMGELATYL